MKAETRLIVLIICLVIGIGLMLWGSSIMRNYEGYLEIFKAARREALPQFISGLVILVGAYIVTYLKSK